MITRYALFEGQVKKGQTEAFRAAVLERILPHWKQFPGAVEVRVMFSDERDEGAPEFPLVLAISYPDKTIMQAALGSDARANSKAATEAVVAEFFDGRIHHHVTQAHSFALEQAS
ncbi:MAG: hypothetical protein KTR21_14205 [Rhodobacteraceae bacterium]|nr:hypothetical protein [Paracoccaceae bacterium]